MKCPICDSDLSPLDLVSRTEHVDLCIENGPSILEVSESGQLVVKRNLPPGKQRKICPICDKTFQNLNQHFKVCAIKNDVPPNLMLDYWDKINSGTKNPKKFPREILDTFVAKCIKEGRLGDQVDFARALSLSMAEGEPESSRNRPIEQPIVTQNVAEQLLMNAQPIARETTTFRKQAPKKRYRLELVDELTKRANVELRIDRELAATRSKRYEEAFQASRMEDDEIELKDCNGSESCLSATCQDHELILSLEEYKIYSGASMDAPPKRQDPQAAEGEVGDDASDGLEL